MWNLQRYSERYAVSKDATIPCVLIPGWSAQGDIFEWVLPALSQHFIVDVAYLQGIAEHATFAEFCESLFDEIQRVTDKPVWLVGWSLGGNVALEIAAKNKDKVLGVSCLSTTPVFVETESWPYGMKETVFSAFQQGLKENVAKTLKRFDILQAKNDREETKLNKSLKDYRKKLEEENLSWSKGSLLKGLEFLEVMDQRSLLGDLQLPCQFIIGENDNLLSVGMVEALDTLNANVSVVAVEGVSHLPFLTHSDVFFDELLSCASSAWKRYEKQKIAKSFSKAAKSYDDSAKLQQEVAKTLYENVPVSDGLLLDVGCGTSFMAEPLASLSKNYLGVDLAEGMLHFSRQNKELSNAAWIASDMQSLALADNSVRTIFSSLAVQWSENFLQLLDEWFRVLKPGGMAYIATMGPNTLFELRKSFSAVDQLSHVNNFTSESELRGFSLKSKLQLVAFEAEERVLAYANVKSLMYDLKHIGAQQVLGSGRAGKKGLMGKQSFQKVLDAYEQYRGERVESDLLPATYEVYYLQLSKSL